MEETNLASEVLADFQNDFEKYSTLCNYASDQLEIILSNLQKEMKVGSKLSEGKYNIIKSYSSRRKTFKSTFRKLQRQKLPMTIESLRSLHDIYGIRIITLYRDDIDKIVEMLEGQNSITVTEKKDYVNEPKENGYSGFHLIVGIDVCPANSERVYRIPVEIQIRTVAMDIWGESEHVNNYKRTNQNPDTIQAVEQAYKELSEDIRALDNTLIKIRDLSGSHAANGFLADFMANLDPQTEE